ncbi:WD repeat-containing protein 25 [Aplysia californica]|uniref:WD repeat-containing protein 25 n=1 Tax=Aplysia californica TaxID=6500 RepID=A0ABM0JPQ2_APLCA|nr:WD repeat-containing protein 25 [Aplysia californica]
MEGLLIYTSDSEANSSDENEIIISAESENCAKDEKSPSSNLDVEQEKTRICQPGSKKSSDENALLKLTNSDVEVKTDKQSTHIEKTPIAFSDFLGLGSQSLSGGFDPTVQNNLPQSLTSVSSYESFSCNEIQKSVDTPFGTVEIPNGDFWKDFTPDKDMILQEGQGTANMTRTGHSVSTVDSNRARKRSSQHICDKDGTYSTSPVFSSKRSLHHGLVYSCSNSQQEDSDSSHALLTRVVSHSNTVVTPERSSSNNSERKIFFVHSKIAPYLHSKTSCKCSHKLSDTWKAHSTVINRLNWNVPTYAHLLLTAGMNEEVRVWNVWSTLDSCVSVLHVHKKPVKHAEWSHDGKAILSCSYDRTALVTDVESGKVLSTCEHPGFVTAGCGHQSNPSLFMTGTDNMILLWDRRVKEVPVKSFQYKDKFGQVQDIIFSSEQEIVSCSDLVARDSADRGIMAWDVRSGVVLSNQIYQERYSCTRLKVHSSKQQFLAQSQGGYVALFSTSRPYKMDKAKRFDGHKVQGYSVGFDISADGSLVYSGSCEGGVHCYDHRSGRLIRKLGSAVGDVITDVACHPVLPSFVASCTWAGSVSIWF